MGISILQIALRQKTVFLAIIQTIDQFVPRSRGNRGEPHFLREQTDEVLFFDFHLGEDDAICKAKDLFLWNVEDVPIRRTEIIDAMGGVRIRPIELVFEMVVGFRERKPSEVEQ